MFMHLWRFYSPMQIYAEATKDLKKSELINFDEYFAKQKKAQSGN